MTYTLSPGQLVDVPGHPTVAIWLDDARGVFRVGDLAEAVRLSNFVYEFADIPGSGLQVRMLTNDPLVFEVRVRPPDQATVAG